MGKSMNIIELTAGFISVKIIIIIIIITTIIITIIITITIIIVRKLKKMVNSLASHA